MDIVRGSVIALAYVEFKPDTPTKEVDLVTSHLRTNADRLYSTSSLPSAWGGLVSYLVSPNTATLDGATMELVPEHRTKSGKLGTGNWVLQIFTMNCSSASSYDSTSRPNSSMQMALQHCG
jgi:hypothetical protein